MLKEKRLLNKMNFNPESLATTLTTQCSFLCGFRQTADSAAMYHFQCVPQERVVSFPLCLQSVSCQYERPTRIKQTPSNNPTLFLGSHQKKVGIALWFSPKTAQKHGAPPPKRRTQPIPGPLPAGRPGRAAVEALQLGARGAEHPELLRHLRRKKIAAREKCGLVVARFLLESQHVVFAGVEVSRLLWCLTLTFTVVLVFH